MSTPQWPMPPPRAESQRRSWPVSAVVAVAAAAIAGLVLGFAGGRLTAGEDGGFRNPLALATATETLTASVAELARKPTEPAGEPTTTEPNPPAPAPGGTATPLPVPGGGLYEGVPSTPVGNGELVVGDFRFSAVSTLCDFADDLGATAVVTTSQPQQTARLVMTFYGPDGTTAIGSADTVVFELQPGVPQAVEFVGVDDCAAIGAVDIEVEG